MEDFKWLNKNKKVFLSKLSSKGKSYFVGGAVRDSIFYSNYIPKDLDIATPLTPSEIMQLCKKEKWHCIPTGIEHGTITVIVEKQIYEVTSFRKDVITYGRKAKVQYTQSVKEDCRRRDLTINAIYLDENREIFDPWNGIQDIKDYKIRFIGNADTRICEDFLRILRYFRFCAHYGKNTFDQEAIEACEKNKIQIYTLAKERITKEILKTLQGSNSLSSLTKMYEMSILKECFQHEKWKQNLIYAQKIQLKIDSVIKIALMITTIPEKIFSFSKAEKKVINHIASHEIIDFLSEKEILIWSQFFTYDEFKRILTGINIKLAARKNIQEKIIKNKIQEALKLYKNKELPIKGKDLLGILPTYKINKTIRRLKSFYLEQNREYNKQECIEKALKINEEKIIGKN